MHDFIVTRLQPKHAVLTVNSKTRASTAVFWCLVTAYEFQTRNKPVYLQVMFITQTIIHTNINDDKTIVFQVKDCMR